MRLGRSLNIWTLSGRIECIVTCAIDSASLPQNALPLFVGASALSARLHPCFVINIAVFTLLFVSMILNVLVYPYMKHALAFHCTVCLDSNRNLRRYFGRFR
jgi:hypothetical protein